MHARIRVSAERDGAYLAFESMSLAVEAIRIETISDHSRRWGVLLGTVTGLQWLLSGFLERKLLDLISSAVVEQNQHQLLFTWDEIPLFRDFDAKVASWQAKAARREASEQRAVRRIQRHWQLHRQRVASRQLRIRLGVDDEQAVQEPLYSWGSHLHGSSAPSSNPSPVGVRRFESDVLAMAGDGVGATPASYCG